MLKRINSTVLIIFVGALLLRIVGITNGFPFIFHPDEPTIVRSALGIRFFPNPAHFDWPHLYIYLNYFLYMGFTKIRTLLELAYLKDALSSFFIYLWDDTVIFYYLTRVFSAILGALTVVPIYMAGKNLFGEKTGVFAALLMALFPYHVWHSHYSLPDVPMVFFLSVAIYFATNIIKRNLLIDFVMTGLMLGLAASTKYHGGLSILLLFIAYVVNKNEELGSKSLLDKAKSVFFDTDWLLKLFAGGLSSLVGFVIGTPYSVLDLSTFVRTDGPSGALWQFTNVGTVTFTQRLAQAGLNLLYKIPDDVGYTPILGFLLLSGYLLYRLWQSHTSREEEYIWVFVLMTVFLYMYISGFEKTRSHYYFIMYPYLAISVGYFISRFSDFLSKTKSFLTIGFVYLVLFVPFYYGVTNTIILANGDTRADLYNFLAAEVVPVNPSITSLVYFDSDMQLILEDTSYPRDKGSTGVQRFRSGYMILTHSTDLNLAKQELVAENLRFATLDLKATVDNTLKNGPKIGLYYYEL